MTDEWAIASLSQVIDEDDDDDDDVLIPPTPGQEDIDMVMPSQDGTSLLGAMADSHLSGRRKLTTLSLGLPDDPESEGLPFLALEWDPQFPPTPAPENGQSAESYLPSAKGKDDTSSKISLASESCNGQSTVWEGCSTSWLTRDAEASGIRTVTGGSGDDNSNKDKKELSEDTKREEKNVDDRGGGSKPSGRDGGGGDQGGNEGNGGGDDDDDELRKKRCGSTKDEEESSHEPSSDSSEGSVTLSESQGAGSGKVASNKGLCMGSDSPREASVKLKFGEGEGISSERDLFSSQVEPLNISKKEKISDFKEIDDRGDPVPLNPSDISLPLTKAEDGRPQTSYAKQFDDVPMSSSSSPPVVDLAHSSPPKRKLSDDEDNGSAEIPYKLPRMDESSGGSEFSEEKVLVDYHTLTKKEVELSQAKYPSSRVLNKPLQSSVFNLRGEGSNSCSSKEKTINLQKLYAEEMSEDIELPSLSPADAGDETFSVTKLRTHCIGMEEDSSGKNDSNKNGKMMTRNSSEDKETKDDSDKDDSDVEIIEDKDKSIEVLYEKPKVQKPYYTEDVGSQDFNLMLSGTQHDSPSLEEQGQHFSQESISQTQSQGLLQLSSNKDVKFQERIMSVDNKEKHHGIESEHNTMPATQMEEICKPAELSQPNIDSLISLPITGSSESRKQSAGAVLVPSSVKSHELTVESQADSEHTIDSQASQGNEISRNVDKSGSYTKLLDDQSQTQNLVTGLQMPDILTPSTQDLMVVHESESLFVKAANAAKERGQHVDKLVEEKHSDKSSSSNGGSSFESSETSKIKAADLSPLPSQLTPVHTGHLYSSSSKLFGSSKKEDISSPDLEGSSVLAEETDSDDDVLNIKKRKRLKAKGDFKSSDSQIQKSFPILKDVIKSSTPNTSQVISPIVSPYDGSDIDKDSRVVSVITETSKSHENTPEQVLGSSKSPDSLAIVGTAGSTEDIDAGLNLDGLLSIDELRKLGYGERSISIQALEYKDPRSGKVFIVVKDPAIEFRHPITNDNYSVVCEKEQGIVSRISLRQTLDSDSFRRETYLRRESDASLLSRTSSSGSGYLGDKSSSSGSSHRMSMLSTSSRLSLGSVMTVSPPRENRDKDLEVVRRLDGDCFVVPKASARSFQSSKTGATSPKLVTIDEGKSEKILSPQNREQKGNTYSSSSTSDEIPSLLDKRRRGRGRGRGSSRSKPLELSSGKGSGRGRGRGKGRGKGRELRASSEDILADVIGDELSRIPTEKLVLSPKTPNVKRRRDVDSPMKRGEAGESISLSGVLGSLPESVRKLIDSSQIPLSEEEEEVFFHEGADQERQLGQILKRVREIDLKPGLLVFARFVDNSFYSAVLKEKDGADRWHVQFTLDRHDSSVRDVYVLPTDILPRGHLCYVKHKTEQFSDPGVVRGHVRDGPTLFHIVETDRGNTERVMHSHIFLTEQQANKLLSARHHFRSMVASPGRDVSLDNIVAGTRRRTPNIQASSHSKKVDVNLESSESAMGEFDEISPSNSKKTPSRGRKGSRKQILSDLLEESEMEDASYTPGTPRGRKRAGNKLSRTPKAKKSVPNVDIVHDVVTPDSKKLSVTDSPQLLNVQEVRETPKTPLKKRGRQLSQKLSTPTPLKLSNSEEEPCIDPRLGPVPSENSEIFSGFEILLTNGDNSLRKRQSSDEEDLPPFNKEHLKNQIVRGGGKVIESYTDAEIILAQQGRPFISKQTPKSKKSSGHSTSTILLISNTHCQTPSYIQCLAAGIPIVSFEWVIFSCHQNKYLDWRPYLLPSGENEHGETFEQSLILEEGFQHGPPGVLEGELAFLASSNKEFTSLWQPILTMARADVKVRPAKMGNLNRVLTKSITVVIADEMVPDNELQRAQQLNIPVVSTNWVIQSLIAGKRLGYRENPKFVHDSVSQSSSKPEEK